MSLSAVCVSVCVWASSILSTILVSICCWICHSPPHYCWQLCFPMPELNICIIPHTLLRNLMTPERNFLGKDAYRNNNNNKKQPPTWFIRASCKCFSDSQPQPRKNVQTTSISSLNYWINLLYFVEVWDSWQAISLLNPKVRKILSRTEFNLSILNTCLHLPSRSTTENGTEGRQPE